MYYKIVENKDVLKELKKYSKKYETCDIKILKPSGCIGDIIFYFNEIEYKVGYLVDANKTTNIYLSNVYTKSNLFSILCSNLGFYIQKYRNAYNILEIKNFENELKTGNRNDEINKHYVSQIIIGNKNKVWEHKELVSDTSPMFWT